MSTQGLGVSPEALADALAVANKIPTQSTKSTRSVLKAVPPVSAVRLSDEQLKVIERAKAGDDIIVDAAIGSGKTSTIVELCNELGDDLDILYLTYSRLLKDEARERVLKAKAVHSYHAVVYPSLMRAGIRCGLSESIRRFNESFKDLSASFPRYDLLVVDEYQDITEEHAELIRNIKSVNPLMQMVFVGDMSQKVRSDTVIDVRAFLAEITEDAVHLPFTQSFRMGSEMGELLGEAWGKPIVGVNPDQKVREMSYGAALRHMGTLDTSDILVLGRRKGEMGRLLNDAEEKWPEKFNKNTVYASIKDSDGGVTYGPNSAIFTTFDSSKGLERHTVFVFDYDETVWLLRNKMPNADPEILRNVFLVAASRAKHDLIFVASDRQLRLAHGAKGIGFIPMDSFTTLIEKALPAYPDPIWASQAFDFKYAENVRECYELLDLERLDDGLSPEIEIGRQDGLIDLSPVVGHYQEARFFLNYSAADEIFARKDYLAREMLHEVGQGDAWRDSLALATVDSGQRRYIDQVTATIPDAARSQLLDRLSEQLPRDARIQVGLSLQGEVYRTRKEHTSIMFTGVLDALYDHKIYELKFVSELSHAMFLQLALYLVMGEVEEGVLWNTRTNERWRVRLRDREVFMNAVTKCVTKQSYGTFKRA